MVILCVILISIGKDDSTTKNKQTKKISLEIESEVYKYRVIAIFLAILEGIFFSIRTGDMQTA